MNPILPNALGSAPGGARSLTDAQSVYLDHKEVFDRSRGAATPDGFRPTWNAQPIFDGGSDPQPAFGTGRPDTDSPCCAGSPAQSAGEPGGFAAIIKNLIAQLTSLLGQTVGESNAEGPATQNVSQATFASTGDPHLSETGSVQNGLAGPAAVNEHFDSMVDHANLVSSQDFDGGFRLSTAVTTPNEKGVTLNASATVHLNNDNDNVTLRNDGTYAIATDGKAVSLEPGQRATLDGGAVVSRNGNGSLTVTERNAYGGSVTTTLEAKSGGVDATAEIVNASAGGDIAAHRDSRSVTTLE